ncbi:MAG: hypothetical protein PVF83_12480 [Anaerolineales bacterium]|jgi:hypothetical protein
MIDKPKPEKGVITIEVDGEAKEVEVYRYPNGAMKDASNGLWIAPPSPNTFEDPEKAKEANLIRRMEAAEKAREGMIRAVEEKKGKGSIASATDAWGHVIEAQTARALKGGKDSTAPARFVGQSTGMVENRRGRPEIVTIGGAIAVGVLDTDTVLLQMFNRIYPDDPQKALDEMKAYKENL